MRLGRCPLDGELCSLSGIVDVLLDDPGQTKVGHFAHIALTDQDVPCSEVTMDVGMLLQVGHAYNIIVGDDKVYVRVYSCYTCIYSHVRRME